MRQGYHYLLEGVLLSLILRFLPCVSATTCYLPNGEVAPSDQPCFPQNPVSSCCGGSTYVCSTNNMCAHYSGEYFVIGSCTDKTWNSPACPGYCFFRDHIHNSVFRCSADKYCCADGPTCNCTTGINTHDIQDFLPPYADLVGSSITINTAVVTSSLFTPIGATSTPMTSAPASTTETSSTASTTSTRPVSTLSNVSPSPSSTGATGEENVSGNNSGMKIGLGVGISVGVVAIGLLALWYMMWRRSKKNKPNIQTPYTQYKSPSHNQTHPLAEMPGEPPRPPGPIYEAP
ncbi:hypothetical protein BDV27DRAFT_124449 [Aspergillus caelatus]|uniref:Mid2 domain-containing protein n=1 Tax=Aspergillus caelatus TaxID=61420 RepID=A0A5N7AD40_9EURO|nr:uncharacterized protein BDV27DRAFT_124449 [Aspergillus caelatus]KAE8367086.1 hypothetical protein BDV27DRAFT_124449 [Aspergillus caelatus]